MTRKEAYAMNLRARLCAFALFLIVSTAAALADGPARAGKPPAQSPQEPQIDLSKPLLLEDAIRIGLQNQNQIGIARSQLESSRARVTQSMANYYPSVAPQYQFSNQLSAFNTGGTTRSQTVEQAVASIGLRWLLFDMGKREENVLVSRYSARASEFNVLDTRQAVIVNVSTSYYDLLRRKELVKVARATVERTSTTLEATRAFVKEGKSPAKDVLQAEADYDNAKVQLIIAENDVRLAQITLKNAMGILTATPIITPDDPLDTPSTMPDTRAAAEYLAIAYDSRPDLKRETASIDANRHSVKVAHINAGVSIEADMTEGYRFDPNAGENRTFVTTFSYPLFDAGLTRAQVRQAKASLEQSRLQLELTKQQVQFEVEQAYILREEARQRIVATAAAVKAARENYEAARAAQREGAETGTIIDVITASAQLVTAETNAVQAIFDFYTSDARLRRAVGNNDPYLAGGKKP